MLFYMRKAVVLLPLFFLSIDLELNPKLIYKIHFCSMNLRFRILKAQESTEPLRSWLTEDVGIPSGPIFPCF